MMQGEAGPSQDRRWRFRWLVAAVLVSSLATCSLVEPMRWRLPPRYLFKHLDIHRTVLADFTMCMRAELSPSEAQHFLDRLFEPEARVERLMPMDQAMCPASFWPNHFNSNTMGLRIQYWPNGLVEGSDGAVYESGFLYVWSNTS